MGFDIFDKYSAPNDLGFNALSYIDGLLPALHDAAVRLQTLQASLSGKGSTLASDNGFLLQMQAAMSQIQTLTQSVSQIVLIGGEIGKSIVSNIR